jgi:hypothetical protein
MSRVEKKEERLMDLLALEAVQKLSIEEQQELKMLLDLFPEYTQDHFHEMTALAQVSFYTQDNYNNESIPRQMRKRILHAYKAELGRTTFMDHVNHYMRVFFYKPQYAWTLTVLMTIGLSFSMIEFKDYENNFKYLPLKRAVLEMTANDIIQFPWYSRSVDLEGISGNIIWSDEGQKGFIKLTGMPMNDPTQNQYQVWIVDPLNHEQPVDGGVFDVTQTDQSVIIPINPKLPISRAVGFAITLEQPGGVVVSSQPILLTAPKERPQITI